MNRGGGDRFSPPMTHFGVFSADCRAFANLGADRECIDQSPGCFSIEFDLTGTYVVKFLYDYPTTS